MAKDRMEELAYTIAGLEVAILSAMEQKDWHFKKMLDEKKKDLIERLRRVSYGLSEESIKDTEG